MIRFICGLLLFSALSSCGTDSGNPGLIPTFGSSPVTSQDLFSDKMCAKLNLCAGADITTCRTQTLTAAGVTNALGLNVVTYPTLNDALTGYTNGALHLSQSNYAACEIALSGLGCADPLVTSSYSSLLPNDFSRTYRLLSVSSTCHSSLAP
jgi:hypothetical protein